MKRKPEPATSRGRPRGGGRETEEGDLVGDEGGGGGGRAEGLELRDLLLLLHQLEAQLERLDVLLGGGAGVGLRALLLHGVDLEVLLGELILQLLDGGLVLAQLPLRAQLLLEVLLALLLAHEGLCVRQGRKGGGSSAEMGGEALVCCGGGWV